MPNMRHGDVAITFLTPAIESSLAEANLKLKENMERRLLGLSDMKPQHMTRVKKLKLVAVAIIATSHLIAASALGSHDKTVGVLGDSVATGAVSDHGLQARFWSIATTLITNFGTDFPKNAFTMVTASGFGVKSENVINAAVDGKRVDDIAGQTQALLKKTKVLPDYVFLSFTANDACSEEIFDESIDAFRAKYSKSLIEGANGVAGLRYLVRQAPKDRDTSIYLLASLNFAQVLTNPSILDRKVRLHNSVVRCERFRAGEHKDDGRMTYLADKLKMMCPAILGTAPFEQDERSRFRRQHLAEIHRAMLDEQQRAIAILNNENKNPRLKLKYIGSPGQMEFQGHHVANDCFHLSPEGQGLLGITIWQEIFDGL